MVNPFFNSSGPISIIDICKILNIKTDINDDIKIEDIKDLISATKQNITF